MKRIFDIFFSAAGLIALSPLFAVCAVLIKSGSRGPVFFVQERVGRNFRPFMIYKFRTMTADAPEKGPQITVGGDNRVTKFGRILRKTKLDELPQLINVLKGEMSIVGPRPEVEKYVNHYRQAYEEVLRIRPGITDIASLRYRNEEAVLQGKKDPEEYYLTVLLPEKIALAREYAGKVSLTGDIRLIVRTLFRLFYPDDKRRVQNPEEGGSPDDGKDKKNC